MLCRSVLSYSRPLILDSLFRFLSNLKEINSFRHPFTLSVYIHLSPGEQPRRNLAHIYVINTILMRRVLVSSNVSQHTYVVSKERMNNTHLPSTVAAVVHVRKLLHNFNLNGIFFSCGYFLFAHPQVRHPFSLTLLPLFFLFTFFPSTPSEPERKSSRMFLTIGSFSVNLVCG